MDIPFLKRQKTVQELEDEIRRKQLVKQDGELDFTIEQKREMLRRLKEHGVSKKSFGSYRGIWEWLKKH
jgi:hypothetical protein